MDAEVFAMFRRYMSAAIRLKQCNPDKLTDEQLADCFCLCELPDVSFLDWCQVAKEGSTVEAANREALAQIKGEPSKIIKIEDAANG